MSLTPQIMPDVIEGLLIDRERLDKLNRMDTILANGTLAELQLLSIELYDDPNTLQNTIKRMVDSGVWYGVTIKIPLN